MGYTTQPSVFCNLSECNKSENLHTVHYIHNTVCIPNMPMEYFTSKKQNIMTSDRPLVVGNSKYLEMPVNA